MPIVKSFTQAQWDAAAHRLDALQEKPVHEHRVNVRDAVKSMRSQISGAQTKGFTLEEIVQQVAPDGVKISASTLRYAMKCAAKEDESASATKNVITNMAADASPRAKKLNKTRPSHAGSACDEYRQDGGKAVSKPGSMVIRDALVRRLK